MATHTLTRTALLLCILHFISATYVVDTTRLDVNTGSGAWETRREGPVLAEGESSSSTGMDHELSAQFSRDIQQEEGSEDAPLSQHRFEGPDTEIEALDDLPHHSHDWAAGHDHDGHFMGHQYLSSRSDGQLPGDEDVHHGGDLQSLHQHSSEHMFHENSDDMPTPLDVEPAMADAEHHQEAGPQLSDAEALYPQQQEVAVPQDMQRADGEVDTSLVDPQLPTGDSEHLPEHSNAVEPSTMEPVNEHPVQPMLPEDDAHALDAASAAPSQSDTAAHAGLPGASTHTAEIAEEQHLLAAADAIDALTTHSQGDVRPQQVTAAGPAAATAQQHAVDQALTGPTAAAGVPADVAAEADKNEQPQHDGEVLPAEQAGAVGIDDKQLSTSGDANTVHEAQPAVGPGLQLPLEQQSGPEELPSAEQPQPEEQQGGALPDSQASAANGGETAVAGPTDVTPDESSTTTGEAGTEGDETLPAGGAVGGEQHEGAADEGVQPGDAETLQEQQQHTDEPPHPEELQTRSADGDAAAAVPEHHDAYDSANVHANGQAPVPETISEHASHDGAELPAHDASTQTTGDVITDHYSEPSTATEEEAAQEGVMTQQSGATQEDTAAGAPVPADVTAGDAVTPSLTEQQLESVTEEAAAEVEGQSTTPQNMAGGEEQHVDPDVSGGAAAAAEESAADPLLNPDATVNLEASRQDDVYADLDLPGAEHIEEAVIPAEDDSDDTGNHTAVALELTLPPGKPQKSGNHRATLCAAVFMLLGCIVCYNLYISSTSGRDHKGAEAIRAWCCSIPGAQSLLLAVQQWSSGHRQAPFSAIYTNASTPLLVMDYCNNGAPNKARGKRDTSFSGNDKGGDGAWASSRADLEAGSRGSYARTSRAPSKGSY